MSNKRQEFSTRNLMTEI